MNEKSLEQLIAFLDNIGTFPTTVLILCLIVLAYYVIAMPFNVASIRNMLKAKRLDTNFLTPANKLIVEKVDNPIKKVVVYEALVPMKQFATNLIGESIVVYLEDTPALSYVSFKQDENFSINFDDYFVTKLTTKDDRIHVFLTKSLIALEEDSAKVYENLGGKYYKGAQYENY